MKSIYRLVCLTCNIIGIKDINHDHKGHTLVIMEENELVNE